MLFSPGVILSTLAPENYFVIYIIVALGDALKQIRRIRTEMRK